MDTPRLHVDLGKIRRNTRTVLDICRKRGIELVGVTKGVSGMPRVAAAMLEEGISCLADARIRNIEKMRSAGITARMMMLRLPRFSHTGPVVRYTDVSLNSEWRMIRSLARESKDTGKTHGVILMVDIGDLREGILYTRPLEGLKKILSLGGIEFLGIGTNVGCYGGVLPTEENMGILAEIARDIKKRFGIDIPVVSVGGTNCLLLIKNGRMPREINQIRVGEGILLGRDSSRDAVLEDTYQDAFTLAAEIVEIKRKPSLPIGRIGKDAFGNTPDIQDRGVRRRAIVALGKQDVCLSGLIPVDQGVRVLGGSSDYIILDINGSRRDYALGDEVSFHLLYPALLSVTTSPYVAHSFKEEAP